MKEFTYVITEEIGIHARPAGALMKYATGFKASCMIYKGEKSADIKRLMKLVALGARNGDTVRVVCEGEDEDEAIAGLENYFKTNL